MMISEPNRVSRFIPKKLGLFVVAFDLLAFITAYSLQWLLLKQSWSSYSSSTSFSFSEAIYFQALFFSILIAIAIAIFADNGDYTRRIPWWSQVKNIAKIMTLSLLLNGFAYFSLQVDLSILIVATNWALAVILLIFARYIAFSIISKSEDWELPVVILGDEQMIMDTLFAFSSDGFTGYKPKFVLIRDEHVHEFDSDSIPPMFKDIKFQRIRNEYDQFIIDNPSYFYIIGMEGFRGDNRDILIDALNSNGVDYAIIPPTKRLYTQGMRPHHFFGTDIILLQDYRRMSMPLSVFLKRLMDFVVSSCTLPLLAVITAIVFALKNIEGSKTPVFYNGERLGKDGKMFKCWKFCTMKENGDQILDQYLEQNPESKKEWEIYKKLKNDPRVDSKISAILRKTSLDEVPQLWNIFVGNMALVGPRPILKDQEEEYGKNIPFYCSVRPGLTGLWQVSGRNEFSFEQRVAWDDWYIRNWSLWHDIVILFKTVAVIITRKGAY